MHSLLLLLPILLITSHLTDAFQISFPFWQILPSPQQTITPEFDSFIEQILQHSHINGLSLSIVRKHGLTEYGAWGNKSEDGVSMTPTVSGVVLASTR